MSRYIEFPCPQCEEWVDVYAEAEDEVECSGCGAYVTVPYDADEYYRDPDYEDDEEEEDY